ncbi:CHAD domain-containing protein [Ancylobacter lacus]|nr:CHAD domain-containing protein [Ancylobacter lacus]MBS7538428.1 CHAD domain-containing protein [Ancylobacter lacus]
MPGPLEAALAAAGAEAGAALKAGSASARIHDLRKAAKRLRALLRLLETPGDNGRAAALRRQIAQEARALAGSRDAAAMREALADLAGHDDAVPGGFRLPEPAAAPDPTGEALAAAVQAAAAEMAAPARALHTGELLRRIARFYRKARRAARTIDPDDAEALHELRKQVVVHRYQLELIAPFWPRLGALWLEEAQKLRDQLGRHHDLDVLAGRLEAGADAGDEAGVAVAAAARRLQHRLARKALRRHARLFAERGGAFRRRWRRYRRA